MANESGETITISIRRPTDTPAVFVAGSFSDPAWEPVELNSKPTEANGEEGEASEYVFSHDFKIPEGKYEYRFRLGSDGPWIHDDGLQTGAYRCAF